MTTKRTIWAGSNADEQLKSLVAFYGFEETLKALRVHGALQQLNEAKPADVGNSCPPLFDRHGRSR